MPENLVKYLLTQRADYTKQSIGTARFKHRSSPLPFEIQQKVPTTPRRQTYTSTAAVVAAAAAAAAADGDQKANDAGHYTTQRTVLGKRLLPTCRPTQA